MARATDERRVEALRLRAQGYGYKRLAKALGVSPTTARRLVKPGYEEHLRALSRDAKRRRRGTCRCGAETAYNGRTGEGVSDTCVECAKADTRARGIVQRGHGKVVGPVLAYCATPRSYGAIRDRFGLTGGHASQVLNRLVGYGLLTRLERGVYISARQDRRSA